MTDMSIVLEAAQKWADELTNYIIPDAEKRGADEDAARYGAEFDTVTAAIEAVKVDTSIDIYLTGDSDGPDMFGVIYDDEDGVLETARENEMCAWRVPVQPNLDGAALIYEHKEDPDE